MMDFFSKLPIKKLHLIIIVSWLIPYIMILELRQIVTPYIVTIAFIIIDIIASHDMSTYKKLSFHTIWTNIVGMIFMTLFYVFSNYSFWKTSETMDLGHGFLFAGLWDIIYSILLCVAIGISYLIMLFKIKLIRTK